MMSILRILLKNYLNWNINKEFYYRQGIILLSRNIFVLSSVKKCIINVNTTIVD